MVKVVAGVAKTGKKYLVTKRPFHKQFGGKWEFPGGKLEQGESNKEGLIREFKEELSLDIDVGELIGIHAFSHEKTLIEISFFWVYPLKKEMSLNEHIDAQFVKLKELKVLDLCPSDKYIIDLL